MNTTNDTPRIKVRLSPTETRRRENRLRRYAAKLWCRMLKMGRGSAE